MNKSNQTLSPEVEALLSLLGQLERERFFGEVQLSFQNGMLTLVRQTRTIKPSELVTRGDGQR